MRRSPLMWRQLLCQLRIINRPITILFIIASFCYQSWDQKGKNKHKWEEWNGWFSNFLINFCWKTPEVICRSFLHVKSFQMMMRLLRAGTNLKQLPRAGGTDVAKWHRQIEKKEQIQTKENVEEREKDNVLKRKS